MGINLLFTGCLIMMGIVFITMSDRAESLDITRSVQGTFKEAKAGSIDILGASDSKEIQIAIGPNTVYDNVQKLTDLKAGDKVQVEYQTIHNKNTAITVTKMEVEG